MFYPLGIHKYPSNVRNSPSKNLILSHLNPMNRPIFDFCEIFTIYILDGTVLNAEWFITGL